MLTRRASRPPLSRRTLTLIVQLVSLQAMQPELHPNNLEAERHDHGATPTSLRFKAVAEQLCVSNCSSHGICAHGQVRSRSAFGCACLERSLAPWCPLIFGVRFVCAGCFCPPAVFLRPGFPGRRLRITGTLPRQLRRPWHLSARALFLRPGFSGRRLQCGRGRRAPRPWRLEFEARPHSSIDGSHHEDYSGAIWVESIGFRRCGITGILCWSTPWCGQHVV